MKNKSIVFVLTSWYTIAFLSSLLVFGFLTYIIVTNRLLANVNETLERNALWINQLYEEEKSDLEEEDESNEYFESLLSEELIENLEEGLIGLEVDYLIFINDSNEILYTYSTDTSSFDILSLMPIPTNDIISHKPTNTQLIIIPLDEKYVIIAKSLKDLNDSTAVLLRSFLMVLPFVLIVTIVGGYFLTKRTLRPINKITSTVSTITSENLSKRVPERSVDDELGQLIKTFNSMLESLENSFHRLWQFSSDASHELRTPLTIIRNTINNLIRENLSHDEQNELLLKLENEVIRTSEIVDNLLLLNKIEQKKEELQLTEYDMHVLFNEIAEDTEILAMGKNISVKIIHVEDVKIKADISLIRRMLLNLVDNAVKFTPAGGKILLSLKKEGGSVVCSLSDTGIGIPQDQIDKIFDRFYRVDQSRNRLSGGAGLGLSICKWIVDAHQGTIKVSSTLVKGTAIEIHLPLE